MVNIILRSSLGINQFPKQANPDGPSCSASKHPLYEAKLCFPTCQTGIFKVREHLAPNLNQTSINHIVQFLHTHSVVTILATYLHRGKRTILLTTEGLALSVLKSPVKIIPSPFPVLLHFFPLVIPRLVSVQEPQKSFLIKYKHFLCKSFSSVNAQDDVYITRGQDQLNTLLAIW